MAEAGRARFEISPCTQSVPSPTRAGSHSRFKRRPNDGAVGEEGLMGTSGGKVYRKGAPRRTMACFFSQGPRGSMQFSKRH